MKSINSEIQQILIKESEAVLNVPIDNPYQKALDIIHAAHKKHGTLVVTGVGKAGDVGKKIVSTFNSVGIKSVFLSTLDARHGGYLWKKAERMSKKR